MKRGFNIFFLMIFTFLFVAALAMADTIILKNGQKIHTSWLKIENGLLTYKYTYGTMSIKMELVKEIKKDDTSDPKKEQSEVSDTSDSSSSSTQTAATTTESAGKEKDPKESGSYWNNERKRLLAEKTQIEADLKDLENYRVALIRARRSTAEIVSRIEEKRQRLQSIDADLAKLTEQARQSGVSQWDIDHADEQNKEGEGGTEER